MTANEIDRTVRKLLENVDIQINDILRSTDAETLNELRDVFWVNLLNIDIDSHIEEAN